MSTKLKFVNNEPESQMVSEGDEFSFGVTTDELSQNAMGGTEMMKHGVYDRLDPNLRDKVQIICSRVREVDSDRPTILWLHDMFNDPESNHLADPKQRERFAKLVFVSNFQKTQYELAYGLKPSEGLILRNCIEPIEYHQKPDPQQGINLIYHTTPHRGLDILVPVFEELCNHYDNLTLDVYSSFNIYGWGERDADYEHLFERCREHPNINYHGYQPNEVVREALKKAHIFAFPSIWPETSCIAAMEAMSAGCCIVHPDFAALPETLAGFGLSYSMHEDPNVHANIFIQVLAAAIQKVGTAAMDNRMEFQKTYADAFYGWDTRIQQWNSLLMSISQDDT
jgi:glycosyltransferase involved in cell wall biosynthesis